MPCVDYLLSSVWPPCPRWRQKMYSVPVSDETRRHTLTEAWQVSSSRWLDQRKWRWRQATSRHTHSHTDWHTVGSGPQSKAYLASGVDQLRLKTETGVNEHRRGKKKEWILNCSSLGRRCIAFHRNLWLNSFLLPEQHKRPELQASLSINHLSEYNSGLEGFLLISYTCAARPTWSRSISEQDSGGRWHKPKSAKLNALLLHY